MTFGRRGRSPPNPVLPAIGQWLLCREFSRVDYISTRRESSDSMDRVSTDFPNSRRTLILAEAEHHQGISRIFRPRLKVQSQETAACQETMRQLEPEGQPMKRCAEPHLVEDSA